MSLVKISLPDGLTGIGGSAFSGCKSLTSVDIPDGVSYTFNGCSSLENIDIPKGITSIDVYMFAYCESLKIVTIPYSVTSIGTATEFLME